MRRLVSLLAVLSLAACGGPGGSASSAPSASPAPASASGIVIPTVEGVSEACVSAFAEQAAPELPSDLGFVAIINACTTLEEVVAANQAIPGALEGQDPAAFVETYCLYPEAQDAPICQ